MEIDGFQQSSDRFTDWFLSQSSASISSKVSIADYRARRAGRGAVAVDDIEDDEELFRVPRGSVISAANSTLSKRLHGVASNMLREDPWRALILVLLYETIQGTSRWQPYLNILPSQFDTLMFWSDSELDQLQTSAIRDKIGRKSADDTFRDQILPVIKDNADVFYPIGATPFTDEQLMALCHRMGSTIMAYAFDLEPEEDNIHPDEDGYATEEEDEDLHKGMVPLADILNADADFNAHLFHEKEFLIMRSVRRIARGEEILNDYGPLPRADLLRRYGYITPKYAKYDIVEIPFALVLDEAKKHNELSRSQLEYRMECLENEECVDEGYLIEWKDESPEVQSGQTPPFSQGTNIQDELLQVIGTLLSDDSKCQKAARSFGNCSPKVKVKCQNVLIRILDARLNQYTTTILDDRKLLNQSNVQGRQRMAVEIRLAEKILLETTRSGLKLEANNTTNSEPASKRQRMT